MTTAEQNRVLEAIATNLVVVRGAEAAMRVAMLRAHQRGVSLRKIAEVAQMSHEQVRRTISADQASGS